MEQFATEEPGTDAGTWKQLAKARPTTPEAELERVKLGLVALGHNSIERDSIQFVLKPGEVIKSFDAWSFTTDRRVLNREADLRPALRPGSWTRVDTWTQFPRIPERV